MKPVIQEEISGCGIAASAAIAGISYREAKTVANRLGIYAQDQTLWSETQPVRILLAQFGWEVENTPLPFKVWKTLPDLALLATKWHLEQGKPFWHWAVFVRDASGSYVLDSKQSLKQHTRKDFGRIKPKWYLPVRPES